MMKADPKEIIEFQSYTFHIKRGSIQRSDGQEVFMEERLKALFWILLINRNDFVSREALIDFVWKDVVVHGQSLTKAVSDLRKFFVAQQMEGLKISTVRKLGYKLEVVERKIGAPQKKKYLLLAMKSLAYVLIGIIVIIILLRAAAYEQ